MSHHRSQRETQEQDDHARQRGGRAPAVGGDGQGHQEEQHAADVDPRGADAGSKPPPAREPVIYCGDHGQEPCQTRAQGQNREHHVEAQQRVNAAEQDEAQAKQSKPHVHDAPGAKAVDQVPFKGAEEAALQPRKREGQGEGAAAGAKGGSQRHEEEWEAVGIEAALHHQHYGARAEEPPAVEDTSPLALHCHSVLISLRASYGIPRGNSARRHRRPAARRILPWSVQVNKGGWGQGPEATADAYVVQENLTCREHDSVPHGDMWYN